MKFVLPYPPSINHYYRIHGSRTLISREGRAFRKNVLALLGGGRTPPFDGRLAVALDAFPPDRRRRDIDNLQKSVADSLQHAGIYHDDNQIDVLLTQRREVELGGKLEVEILPLPLCRCPLCGDKMNSR